MHREFTEWGNRTLFSKGYRFNQSLKSLGLAKDSLFRPDAINPIAQSQNNPNGRIWELKPDSHEDSRFDAVDDRQVSKYLEVLNEKKNISYRTENGIKRCQLFELGQPTELVKRTERLDDIVVLWEKYEVYIYPSSKQGFIYYTTVKKRNSKGAESNYNSDNEGFSLTVSEPRFKTEVVFPQTPGFMGAF